MLLSSPRLLALVASAALSSGYQYDVTYSNGTWKSVGGGRTITGTFGGSSWSKSAQTGGVPVPGAAQPSPGAGSSEAKGPVTATLTWSGPAGTEPAAVVLKETATAAWTGDTQAGSCSDGLGDHAKSTTVDGQSSSDVRYSVRSSPGHSFTTGAVSVSANSAWATNEALVCGTASVSYAGEASPVTLTLSGGKDNAGKEFLVGQQCGASVGLPSGWTATPPPPPYSATAYAWSPGGSADPFKSFTYVPLAAAPSGASGSGHRIDLVAGDKDDPTLTCCFAKAGSGTVSVTVRAVGPDGSVLSVSASKAATVRSPDVPAPPAVNKGRAQFDSGTIHVADADGNINNARGINWASYVSTPSAYGGGGRWGWVQLLQESTTRVVNGVTQTLESGTAATGWFTFGADGTLPSSVWDGAVDGQNFFYADGSRGRNWDAPAEFLDASASSYHVEEHFSDWLMYCPPGTGSQFVPLYKFTWYLVGDASHTAPNGPWTASGLAHDNTAVEANPAFPDWSYEHTNGNSRWRNP